MPEAPTMNQYAVMARRHWRRHLPQRTASLRDPTRFFTQLGAEVEQEIQELAAALAGDDPPGETYLAKVGRLRMARLQAEEQILAERVLLPAEPGIEDDQEAEAGRAPTPATGASQGLLPLVEDPTDPRWQQLRAEHEELRLREQELADQQ
jgi:hypothetical protein